MVALIDYAREGDVVVVVALDRLGRSLYPIKGIDAELAQLGPTGHRPLRQPPVPVP